MPTIDVNLKAAQEVAITKKIVELMGGVVGVESTVGQGMDVRFIAATNN